MARTKLIVLSVVGVFILIILLASVGTVNAGYVGIKTRFGKVVGVATPGLYVIPPFIESVTTMDVQTQKEQVNASAASSDLQTVNATVAVNFHVNQQDAVSIYTNIGRDYQSRIIDPAIQESVKSVTANYTAEQLLTKREEVREKILALLTTKLQTYGVNADALNIVNFSFSESFNQAIEAKVTAEQNALAAKNKLDQVKYEAEQTVAKATADAKAIEIQAQAINSHGGADYVQLQAVAKWDGKLPVQMIPGSTVPFLNLKN